MDSRSAPSRYYPAVLVPRKDFCWKSSKPPYFFTLRRPKREFLEKSDSAKLLYETLIVQNCTIHSNVILFSVTREIHKAVYYVRRLSRSSGGSQVFPTSEFLSSRLHTRRTLYYVRDFICRSLVHTLLVEKAKHHLR